jgi:hypothetical protein
MEAKFTYTEEDYIEARRAWQKHLAPWPNRARPSFMAVGGCLIAVFGTILLFVGNALFIALVCIGYGLFLFLWYGILWPFRLRRAFRRAKTHEHEVAVNISETALELSYLHVEARLEWGAFLSYLETPNLFILWTNSRQFYMLPKRAFGSTGQEALRLLFAQKIPKGTKAA